MVAVASVVVVRTLEVVGIALHGLLLDMNPSMSKKVFALHSEILSSLNARRSAAVLMRTGYQVMTSQQEARIDKPAAMCAESKHLDNARCMPRPPWAWNALPRRRRIR